MKRLLISACVICLLTSAIAPAQTAPEPTLWEQMKTKAAELKSRFFEADSAKTGSNSPGMLDKIRNAFTADNATPATVPPVAILSAAPNGQVSDVDESRVAQVVFNQPMVALEGVGWLDTTKAGPIVLEPQVRGRYRWKGTDVLEFTPTEPFPLNTQFAARIPAGTRSAVSGARLAQDYRWTFSTPRPEVTDVRPWPKTTAQDCKYAAFRSDQTIYVHFSDPIDAKRCVPFVQLNPFSPLELSTPDSLNEIQNYFGWCENKEDVLRIRPKTQWALNTGYRVILKAGLPGKVGHMGMAQADTFQFATFSTDFRLLPPVWADTVGIDPEERIGFNFTNKVDNDTWQKHIRIYPEDPKEPNFSPGWSSSFDLCEHSVYLNLYPNKTYTVVVDSTLQDIYGNRLDRTYRYKLTTGAFRPHIEFLSGHGLIEAYTAHRAPLKLRNVENLKISQMALSKEQIVPYFHAVDSDYSDKSPSASPLQLQPGDKWKRQPTYTSTRWLNKLGLFPIELDSVLTAPTGVALVELDDKYAEYESRRYPKAIYQVTSLGITAKTGYDNTLIAVTRLIDAQPVAGAGLEIRNPQNKIVWSGQTGKDGLAFAPSWRALGIGKTSNYPYTPEMFIIATLGQDLAFISSTWGNGIEPYSFDISTRSDMEPDNTYVGDIFTERGLYRPGETVHVKGILRYLNEGDWRPAAHDSALLQLYVARGSWDEDFIDSVRLPLSKIGSFYHEYKVPLNAKLASYRWRAHVIGFCKCNGSNDCNGWSCGENINGNFRVAEFRPAELEVTVRADRDDYMRGDKAAIFFDANYLFGAPVKNLPLIYIVGRSGNTFAPKGYDGYSFRYTFNADSDYEESDDESGYAGYSTIEEGELKLDGQGKARLDLTLETGPFSSGARYEIQGMVKGNNDQFVIGTKTLTVHPGPFYLGLKPSTFFGQKDKSLDLNVLALKPDGTKVTEKVTVRVGHRVWHSVRKVGVGGRLEWHTERVDSIVYTTTVTTQTGGVAAIAYTPRKAGEYYVIAESADKQIKASTWFYATGASNYAWAPSDDDRIDLVADKVEYSPGETATILVKSPYDSCDALVTVEREGVLDHFWLKLRGSAAQFDLPIKEEYLPNVYISVVLLKGRIGRYQFDADGLDLAKPSFKLGYAGLLVNPQSRHLKVAVNADRADYQPGDEVEVEITIPQLKGKSYPAEVTLMAVDEGVLILSNYKTPDPFYAFYNPRPLLVVTSESRLSVIGEREYGEKGENRGGSGGLSSLWKELGGIKPRGNFRTCAHYDPALSPDRDGKIRARFRLPDNLTTFRLMAVTHTANGEFGSGQTKIKVNKRLMVRPVIPRFLRVGDSLDARFIIENYTPKTEPVAFQLDVTGCDLKTANRLTVNAVKDSSVAVFLPMIAASTSSASTAKFTARGKLGEYTDGVTFDIPLIFERPMETVALFGNTTDQKREQIKLPTDVYGDFSTLTASMSSTALTGLGESVNYLFEYPYDCLEQRTSRVLPLILFEDMMRAFDLKTLSKADGKLQIAEYFNMLPKFQTSRGGYAYWPSSEADSPYMTAYACLAAVKARQKGLPIPEASIKKAVAYLSDLLKRSNADNRYPYNARVWGCVDALTVYVLAGYGQYEAAYVERLYNQREQMPLFGLAYLLKAVQAGQGSAQIRDDLRRRLENAVRIEAATAYFAEPREDDLGWLHHSNTRLTAHALQTLLETGGSYSQADKVVRWLMQEQRGGRWRTTQENLYVFWALAEYFNAYETAVPDFKGRISLDGAVWLEELFQGRSARQSSRAIFLSKLPQSRPLDLGMTADGAGRLYYEFRLKYAPREHLAVRNEGFEVKRECMTVKGQPLDPRHLKLGELVQVKITVTTPRDRQFVVVNDPIPAGCEIMDTDLSKFRVVATDPNAAFQPWWGSWNHHEFRDQRCLLFADYLDKGTHTFSYLIRTVAAGRFYTPPIQTEEMYTPEVFGRGEEYDVFIGR